MKRSYLKRKQSFDLAHRTRLRRTMMRTTKPKAGSRREIVRELDKLVRLIVIPRDGHCVTCYAVKNLQVSHFFSRRYLAIRWDLDNVHAMCGSCNLRHNDNQHPYISFMERTLGVDVIVRLSALRWSEPLPTSKLIEMRDELKRYQSEGLRVERMLNQETSGIEFIEEYEGCLV
jgi:hypothetical protein